MGGGSDQRDQVKTVFTADAVELFFLFIGNIGKDQSVYSDLCGSLHKVLCPPREDYIRIGHKDKWYLRFPPDLFHHFKDLIRGHSPGERPEIRRLYDRSFCRRIRERDSQLDQRRARLFHGINQSLCRLKIRIPAGDERDKRLFSVKCFLYPTHRYPPLCILQWQRSLCRPCRKY